MAVVTPLLLTIACGCTDFGRAFHAHTVVSNAARCGAERGSLSGFTPFSRPSWEAAVRTAVETEMSGLAGFDADRLTVDITTSVDGDDLTYTAVEVAYPFTMFAALRDLGPTLTLRHRVEMRQVH
jgi:Flp pilus assembly protein TadG